MQHHRPCLAVLIVFLAASLAYADEKAPAAKPKPKPKAIKVSPLAVAEPKRDKPIDFETEILPTLRRNCLACHSGSKAENHLVLETPQSILKGGDSGPAVVPKKSGESLLFIAADHLDDPTMPPADNKVQAAALSPDELGLLKRWIDEGATGQVLGAAAPLAWRPLPAQVSPILALAISPDGELAAFGRGNQLFVYHLGSGALVARLVDPALGPPVSGNAAGMAHRDLVQSLAFDPSGELLASGAYREVKLWRRPRNVRIAELAGSTDAVRSVAVRPDGKQAATGEAGGTIRLWELPSGKQLGTASGHSAAVTGLRFTPDGAKLVSTSLDKTICVWNSADGKQIAKLDTPAPINALTLASGGTLVCTGDADNTVRVWSLAAIIAPVSRDAKSSERSASAPDARSAPAASASRLTPVKELKGHSGPINSLDTIASSDHEIVSGSEDGSVRQWNVDNGNSSRQFSPGAPVIAVAARPDGKRIASAAKNNTIKIWNCENNQQQAEVKGDFRMQMGIVRLDQAAATARSKATELRKTATEAEQRIKQEADALQKSKDLKVTAEKTVVEKTANLKPYQDAKAAVEKELADNEAAVKQGPEKIKAAKAAAEKDPKNNDLTKAVADAQRVVKEASDRLPDLRKRLKDATQNLRNPDRELRRATAAVESATRGIENAEQSGKQAAVALPGAKAAADAAEAVQKQAEQALDAGRKKADQLFATLALAFSPDNQFLAAGGDNHNIQTCSADSGEPAETFVGPSGAVQAIAWTASGGILAGSADKSAALWNHLPAWSLERTIGSADDPKKPADRVIALDFSPDGKLLATGGGEPSRSGELKLWNPADGSLVKTIADAHSDTIFGVRFSPNGQTLATCAADRFVKLFDVAGGTLVRPLEGHTGHVLGVAWQSDGRILASCGADNVIKVWDVAAGEQRRTIEGFGKEVTSIAFVGASPRVMTACGDRTVRLHNVENGGQERGYGGGNDFLYAVAVSPDGKTVAAGGQEGVLRVWNVENTQLLRTIEPPH